MVLINLLVLVIVLIVNLVYLNSLFLRQSIIGVIMVLTSLTYIMWKKTMV